MKSKYKSKSTQSHVATVCVHFFNNKKIVFKCTYKLSTCQVDIFQKTPASKKRFKVTGILITHTPKKKPYSGTKI